MVSSPVANVVEWLQTSVRPGYDGLMESIESISDAEDGRVLASIQPFTNQRTLINGRGATPASKWPDNYQYRPQTQNKSAKVRGSKPSAHLINAAPDETDDEFFMNKTHSKKDDFFLTQTVGIRLSNTYLWPGMDQKFVELWAH